MTTPLPSFDRATDAIVKIEHTLVLLVELHGVGVNLTRSFTGPDDLRYSCQFSNPHRAPEMIYGWGSDGISAYAEARNRFEKELATREDTNRNRAIAAIRARHEAAAQAEIEALVRL